MIIKAEAAWTNEPAEWKRDPDGRLIAKACGHTDFWRKTRTGFIAENGHLYGVPVRGDFVARVKVTGDFQELYDQAGLMAMLDKTVWVKAGIEYLDGSYYVSSVVTRDYSDWAISRPMETPTLWLLMERDRDAMLISASFDGKEFFTVRECTLTDEWMLEVGPYLAAPNGAGFVAYFEGFEICQARQPRHAAPIG